MCFFLFVYYVSKMIFLVKGINVCNSVGISSNYLFNVNLCF